MSRRTEVRHYINYRSSYGFTIRMTFEDGGLYFECFMIVGYTFITQHEHQPNYLQKDYECGLDEYFVNDSLMAWKTDDIDQAQVMISGRFDSDGWMGVRFHLPTLYFHDKEQAQEFAKLMGRVHDLAKEMDPWWFREEDADDR